MKIIPETDRTVSNKDQVKKVSLIVKPKYSLNIQNAASLTCEKIKLPAPIAKTASATFVSEFCKIGKIIAVVDMPATVA